MGVEIGIKYLGELRCEAVHQPSGNTLQTDAPVDNQGKGESFSPTDLVATALGTCIVTTMGIYAQRHQWDLTGTTVHVTKEMVSVPHRRIGSLATTITIPADKAAALRPEDRTKLETVAGHCPVHRSLHPEIQAPLKFIYG